jgi:hypothetical protein
MTKGGTSLLFEFRHSEIPSSFDIRALSFIFIGQFCCVLSIKFFSDKICCDLLEARLVASKFFTIVLGGTAALHAYRVWGAVIF